MTDSLARLTTALADRYRIEGELGAGGMATVYIAHDVRHDRRVALKVLRPELAAIIGAERFLAEIKTTANLQHPHILGLIDSGEVNGTAFYVMPFVRGESLRDRLEREQQLPIADAIRIATHIAGALDYAHRQGVIHRDIKPENILLHDEQALVADFGIAIALSRPGSEKKRMTETGMSLGTPQYMSPEQAMGERNLDARTDIYALGCVLYEMLSGEPPFTGPNAQAVISKVMTVDPQPVTTLRRAVPANVAAATMVALNKIPADRFPTAGAFSAALANVQYVAPEIAHRRAARTATSIRLRDAVALAAIVLLAVLAAMGWMQRTGESDPGVVARFHLSVPDSLMGMQIVLSRDGKRIIWANSSGIYERRLDSLGIRRLRDPAGVTGTMVIREVSPDGQQVLLGAGGRSGIAVAPLSGGPARVLNAVGGRSALWTESGWVYFAIGGAQGTLRAVVRVPDSGGALDTVAAFDSGTVRVGEDIVVLPNERGFVGAFGPDSALELRAYTFASRAWHPLTRGGPWVQYIEPGYLVYSNGPYVMAVPFDQKRLELTGQPLQIAESPGENILRLKANGNTLVFAAVGQTSGSGIALRSRNGAPTRLPNVTDTLQYTAFAASPDGRRFVAVGAPRGSGGRGGRGPGRGGGTGGAQLGANLYVYALPAGPMQRLRSDARDHSPAWLPGGRELSFVRTPSDSQPAPHTLMKRTWDGTAAPTPLYTQVVGRGNSGTLTATSWLPDGRRAVISAWEGTGRGGGRGGGERSGERGGGRGGGRGEAGTVGGVQRFLLFSLGAPDSVKVLLTSTFAMGNPMVSPDGRLLAYTWSESGRSEVFVGPLDGSFRRQVSPSGGSRPRWSWSGRELFFTTDDTLFAAAIRTSPELQVGAVQRLFSGDLSSGFAVLPGDSTFVTVGSDNRAPPPLTVIVNIRQELDRLFAARRTP